MLNSPLCIGGYSALPSAKLLALGIMQADLPSALAKSQFCLYSLSCGFSPFVLYFRICAKIAQVDMSIQKYRKIVFLQIKKTVVVKTTEFEGY